MVNYKKLGKLLIWRCKQKKVGSQLPTATMAEIEETETVPSILLPCTSCNRTFRPEALAIHSKVCEKILMKKRKQFDSSRQRLQGTEIESFVTQSVPKSGRKKEAQLNLSKSKWKEKVELARTMQAVKKHAESPLSSQVKPSDHEECPYCGRSFGPKAFERHTEFCKEQHHKLRLSSGNINSEAKERLKVRTTYRGPLTNKVLNRDRYQPTRTRDPSPLGTSCIESYDEVNKSTRGLTRNSSLRSSLRSKPEATPPPPLRRTMTQINTPTRGTRGSTKDINETDLIQKTQTLSNMPKMMSKEPNEKRAKPTNSKSETPASYHRKSPLKLNKIDVNTFKELSVISCMIPEPPVVENHYFRPIKNHQSPVIPQSALKTKPTLNIVPKTENEGIQEHSIHLKDENLNYSISQKENAQNSVDKQNHKNQCGFNKTNKNQAFTIEFEPDNRFFVDEHCKVRFKKSPVIFKKRISESFETIKSITDKPENTEAYVSYVEVATNSVELRKESNSDRVNNEESGSSKEYHEKTQTHSAQNDDTNKFNSSNPYFLSWRERVLEFLEDQTPSINPESGTNKHLLKNCTDHSTFPVKNLSSNNSAPESQLDEAKFQELNKTNMLGSVDKHTDIDQELCAIFHLNDKEVQENSMSMHPINNTSTAFDGVEEVICVDKPEIVNFSSHFSINDNISINSIDSAKTTFSLDDEKDILQCNNFSDTDIYFIEENKITEAVYEEEPSNLEQLNNNKYLRKEAVQENFMGTHPIKNTTIALSDVEEVICVDKPENTNCSPHFSINDNISTNSIGSVEATFSQGDGKDILQCNNLSDADIYFIEENKITKAVYEEETSNIDQLNNNKYERNDEPDNNLSDADIYFIEENNIIKAIYEEETNNIEQLNINKCQRNETNLGKKLVDEVKVNLFNNADVLEATERDIDNNTLNQQFRVIQNSPVLNKFKEKNIKCYNDSTEISLANNGNIADVGNSGNIVSVRKFYEVEQPDENNLQSKNMDTKINFIDKKQSGAFKHLERFEDNISYEESNKTSNLCNIFQETEELCDNNNNSSLRFNVHMVLQGNCEEENIVNNNEFSHYVKPVISLSQNNSKLRESQLDNCIKEKHIEKKEKNEIIFLKDSDSLIEDSSTAEKDKILKLAGQQFVLMTSKKNEGYIYPISMEESKVEQYSNTALLHNTAKTKSLVRSIPYCGTYKTNTYCGNKHTNGNEDFDKIYSDILLCLKSDPVVGAKENTTMEELSHRSNYDDSDSVDSLERKSEEAEINNLYSYFEQQHLGYDNSVPYETETLNRPFKDELINDVKCDNSNYMNRQTTSSLNVPSATSHVSSSTKSFSHFISTEAGFCNRASSLQQNANFVPLTRSKGYNKCPSFTLPPINKNDLRNSNSESKNKAKSCEKIGNEGHYSNFSQCYNNFENNHYSVFSNMKTSDEESCSSDFDWDLTDSETYEEKKSVFTHSSKTVYNQYYEQVEYSRESNEFQTVKTSVYQLPFINSEFVKEKEIKLPNIESKRSQFSRNRSKISYSTNVNKMRKRSNCSKLPLLKNFECCKWCFPQVVRHVITTVLPKRFSIEDAERYNPYLSAERQMLELFGADDCKRKNTLPEIHRSSPIQSSPTSAFVKYSSPKRASSVESLKSDNKENNNITSEIVDFPPVEEKMDNRRHFSLSNLSLCSVVSIDSIDCNKNAFNSKLFNSQIDDFQRSFSAVESKSSRAYGKPKVNLQQMLYGSQSLEQSEQTAQSESSNSDTGNLEACEAELLISMLEFEKMLKSSPPSSPETIPNLCSSSIQKRKESEEDAKNRNLKLNHNIDSAYSSLTRSSGADGDTGKPEMSKFCHECGAKYPIAGAKFCCNCGMRRITL